MSTPEEYPDELDPSDVDLARRTVQGYLRNELTSSFLVIGEVNGHPVVEQGGHRFVVHLVLVRTTLEPTVLLGPSTLKAGIVGGRK